MAGGTSQIASPAPPTGLRRRRANFIARTVAGLAGVMERALYAEELAKVDGLLQSLDPRVKLVGLLALIIAAALAHNILVILGLFGVAITLALLSFVPIRTLATRVW